MLKLRSIAVLLLALLTTAQRGAAAGDVPGERQIHWQRSLEDALALAKSEDRPILIAVNMDGESACERIVRERYRDLAFVQTTRPFVCLVASVFRHTPRDHDENGVRIPCPRLGEVTCGEHMALEPVLFEKYLSDGDRVAPRHALVQPDGKKTFDLFLLFDLRDLDHRLADSAFAELARRKEKGLDPSTEVAFDPNRPLIDGYRLAAARRANQGRTNFEKGLAGSVRDPKRHAFLADACTAIAEKGDAGSVGALRVLFAGAPALDDELRKSMVEAARKLGVETAMSGVLRERVRSLGSFPGSIDPDGTDVLLPMLAELDGKDAATRSLLLGCAGIGAYGEHAQRALEIAFGSAERASIEKAVQSAGGACSLSTLLEIAGAVTRSASTTFPAPGKPKDEPPDAVTLERTLAELETAMKERADDPELVARYAKAALDLGRRRIEAGQQGAQFLLEDAEHFFAKALAKRPNDYGAWIERARTAYYHSKFVDEAKYGRGALRVARLFGADSVPNETRLMEAIRSDDQFRRWMQDPDRKVEWNEPSEVVLADGSSSNSNWRVVLIGQFASPHTIEALRWIGDADARLIAERSGKDSAVEIAGLIEGARALGLVAASAFGDATDWTSFASFYGALGMWREELAILQEGARRLPGAQEIRQRMNNSLWNGGRIDLAPFKADWISRQHPQSADALWYAGYAWILAAEDHRRREEPDLAVKAYATAHERYTAAIALRPDFEENARHWIGMTWLGRGFAHLLADRRAEAGEALASGIAAKPAVAGVRDGLDREAVDLLDGALEWRASGSSPVDALALLGKLETADPQNAAWAVYVSDSELREALRADGRNTWRVERDTVDASGKPVRMELGLPTEEGDAYLRRAIEAGRRALGRGASDEAKRRLAQALTIWGERMHARERIADARAELAEAAVLMGLDAPALDADAEALAALATRLRSELGDARPRFRPGR